MLRMEHVQVTAVSPRGTSAFCLVELEQGGTCFALRFQERRTAFRFIRSLIAGGGSVTNEETRVEFTHWAAAALPIRASTETSATVPAHQEFLGQVQQLISGDLPMQKRHTLLLALLRPMLSTRNFSLLKQLSPEILIARISADLPDNLG